MKELNVAELKELLSSTKTARSSSTKQLIAKVVDALEQADVGHAFILTEDDGIVSDERDGTIVTKRGNATRVRKVLEQTLKNMDGTTYDDGSVFHADAHRRLVNDKTIVVVTKLDYSPYAKRVGESK